MPGALAMALEIEALCARYPAYTPTSAYESLAMLRRHTRLVDTYREAHQHRYQPEEGLAF
jgi:hypothetical protein